MPANLMTKAQMKELAEEASGLKQSGGDARVKEIANRLLYRLMQVIDECDVSMEEFWAGIGFIAQTGKNNEFGLLVPGVALEHFLDLRLDEAEKKAGIKGGTLRTIEGPLYVAGAPLSKGEARMDDGTDPGEPFVIEGQVRGEDGNIIAGAIVDLWHANSKGGYSFIDGEQAPYNLRRRIETDEKGRYLARSIVPNGYGCPPLSCTRKAMNLMGRHAERPAHVHFFVSAPGYRKLTTQFNFTGDKYLYTDFAFGTREELVVTLERVTDANAIRNAGFNRPFARATFDVVMTKERAGAPKTEVAREHVIAA
ncbi:MAG: dioxygenase [Bosea sp. (in: a-proteobacteria)]|jgi:catechol 1,2-dioxygenase|uniref:dioxygenase family protein n=1 Tax=Bosea sp. (in: a-proteobacteria) TaxID=1871050 RepID=UPI002734A07C|nr:dioxygenase [Bosea sp. (in: a-proteobacteria)]MDP3601683.1 dioxygenase [Bosea sp. (in: a-proteobacteria)]WRH58405.1 MAG: dioxygenase [Bosea sp. (in: a-proteobacteria)]